MLSKREYIAKTGRIRGKDDVIAYHLRQSFVPGEITPQEANRLGQELAKRFTHGDHAFIVATHTDKKHIHNHIVFHSVNLDCDRKFKNFWDSSKALRRLNDTICIENGYSIVEQPKAHGKSYNKWLGERKKPSNRDVLRAMIDEALAKKPASLDDLLYLIQSTGCEVKCGKQISLRGPQQKRFCRLDTLGNGYDKTALNAVLFGERQHQPSVKASAAPAAKVDLLVDIQAMLRAGKGPGYECWAKVFNLKQMAQTLNYLSEMRLTDYGELTARVQAATSQHSKLDAKIKASEKRLSEIAVLKAHIINYIKTREIYAGYRQSGYSQRYLAEHEMEILLYKAAKKAFNELNVKKLPTVKKLQAEYAEILTEKKKDYAEYRKLRSEMRQLLTAKANVDRLLGYDEKQKEVEQVKESPVR